MIMVRAAMLIDIFELRRLPSLCHDIVMKVSLDLESALFLRTLHSPDFKNGSLCLHKMVKILVFLHTD